MNAATYLQISGDNSKQRYELVKLETNSVYGSGRPGWGVKFQSAASRRLIGDTVRWFETSAQERDDFISQVLAGQVAV